MSVSGIVYWLVLIEYKVTPFDIPALDTFPSRYIFGGPTELGFRVKYFSILSSALLE